MQDRAFQKTITAIYDAALQDDGWGQVIELASDFVGLDVGMGRIADFKSLDSNILGYTGHSGEMYQTDVEDEILTRDPWAQALGFEARDEIFVGSRVVDPEIYMKTPLFAEFMPSYDIGVVDGMGTCISIGEKAMAYFIMYRRMGGDYVQADEIDRYSYLHGHLQRSLNLTCRLSGLRHALQVHQSLLDTLPYGVFGLSAAGKIVMKNRPADRLLSKGTVLKLGNEKLQAIAHEDNRALQRAIARALGPTSRSSDETIVSSSVVKIYPADEGRPWTALACPVSMQASTNGLMGASKDLAALVCVSDHRPIVDLRVQQISNAYGLSAAEESLVVSICSGVSLAEHAAQTGRSVNTLKYHLKNIFSKTEVTSQQDLIRMVLSAPVGI